MSVRSLKALLIIGGIMVGGAEAGDDGQWTPIKGVTFNTQIIGDVRLKECRLTSRFNAKLEQVSAQIECMASNASSFKQDRVLYLEFIVGHKEPGNGWFSETLEGFVLPGEGETRLVANNGWQFWDSKIHKADPDTSIIQVNITVRSSVFYNQPPLEPVRPIR